MISWLKKRLKGSQSIWNRIFTVVRKFQQEGESSRREWAGVGDDDKSEAQTQMHRPEDIVLLTELAGLKDPYSQSAFNLERQIYRCKICGAFYNEVSILELQVSNNLCCIICNGMRIESVKLIRTDRMRRRWKNQSRFQESD